MRLLFVSISVFLFSPCFGGWVRDLISPKGWHLGDSLVLHLTDSRQPNSTFLERHSIMMDYGGYGVSESKIPKRRALEVGLYTTGFGEGEILLIKVGGFLVLIERRPPISGSVCLGEKVVWEI